MRIEYRRVCTIVILQMLLLNLLVHILLLLYFIPVTDAYTAIVMYSADPSAILMRNTYRNSYI